MAKKGGNPSFKPTDEQRAQVTALVVFGHNQDAIAGYIGCSKPTLEKHFAAELRNSKFNFDAMAVSGLFKGLKAGESWAVTYYLRTKGKAFGWSERIILDGSNDPFRGMDLSKLSPAKFRQLMDIMAIAGVNMTLDDQDVLTAKHGQGPALIGHS